MGTVLSGLLLHCFDLTVTSDERSDIGPRIAYQVREYEGQELPASTGAPTPSITIGITDDRDEPTGERSWSPGLGLKSIRISVSLPVSRWDR